MTAAELQTKVFAELKAIGFIPAESLPAPDMSQTLRPMNEIAARLMALNALFIWVAFPEKNAPSAKIDKYLTRNNLRDWLTEEEAEIFVMPRLMARQAHADTIGWKVENMGALAWMLGYETEPALTAAQLGQTEILPLVRFAGGLEPTLDALVGKRAPRSAAEVISLEYRFYCAHNAVRSAQLGEATVPKGFHPVIHGGAIHERRHALTWSLSPSVRWEDMNLDT